MKAPPMSMTGFAEANCRVGGRQWFIELRAVNNRFLDVGLRLPDDARALEPILRKSLSARLSRGKVDCRLYYHWMAEEEEASNLQGEVLSALIRWQSTVRRQFPEAAPLTVADILRWPGVTGGQEFATVHLETCKELIEEALDRLVATRIQEGGSLVENLKQKCDQLEDVLARLTLLLPECLEQYRKKLTTALQELSLPVDEERLTREIVFYAQRSDVEEEAVRLRIHLSEMRTVMEKGGVMGKRLDFLCQELGREANTLTSKSANPSINALALDLKLIIEQMREQVQNIE